MPTSTLTVENILVPANNKAFIDSVIRNTSLAVSDNAVDSDDENDDSGDDASENESGDDVCLIDSDESNAGSGDECDEIEPLPELQDLNISCSKDIFDHCSILVYSDVIILFEFMHVEHLYK